MRVHPANLAQILQLGDLPVSDNLTDFWLAVRQRVPSSLRNGFDSCFMLISWMIWKERNARIFDHRIANLDQRFDMIRDTAKLWEKAGASKLQAFWPC